MIKRGKKTYKTALSAIKALYKYLELITKDEDEEFADYFIDGLTTENLYTGYMKTYIRKTNNGWELEII